MSDDILYEPFDQHVHLGTKPWTDVDAIEKWEAAHGHDVRLKCYPEFGCQAIEQAKDRAEQRVSELEQQMADARVQLGSFLQFLAEAEADDDDNSNPAMVVGSLSGCGHPEEALWRAYDTLDGRGDTPPTPPPTPAQPSPMPAQGRSRILWNRRPTEQQPGGDIDEIVVTDPALVHVEQMDDNEWWLAIYTGDTDGAPYFMGNFTADDDGAMSFWCQEDAGMTWARDDSHEDERHDGG